MLEIIKEAFFSWLWLFGAPIKDANILWIIVPIYVSWFFTEFFQEKKGTGFGNAITNGAVSIWVAVDWFRHITNGLTDGNISTDFTLYVKYGFSALILLFGIIVIINGLQRKEFAHFAGRIRVVTYILIMFTPIIYETAEIKAMNIVPIFMFFPIYYFFLELVVFVVPDSKALQEDKGTDKPKPNPIEEPFKKQEEKYKADFNSVGGTPNNPFDNRKDDLNKNIELNKPNLNQPNIPQNQPNGNVFEQPTQTERYGGNTVSGSQTLQNQNTIIDDGNPFDEPMFQETAFQEPKNNTREQISQQGNMNDNVENNIDNNVKNNIDDNVQHKPEESQEYREPNFDELPNNNEQIWEKIKRKNQL